MKSWAVPKGPSYDPHDKRMAVHVEDHPISYNQFEGTIPDRQYGAGKVIIWDKGTWVPLEDPRKGYREGKLKFELHGHKLHGHWALVRMKGRGDGKQEPWLLIKETDEFARPAAEFSVVDEMPDSVQRPARTGRPPRRTPAQPPAPRPQPAGPPAGARQGRAARHAAARAGDAGRRAAGRRARTGSSRSSSTATACWRASRAARCGWSRATATTGPQAAARCAKALQAHGAAGRLVRRRDRRAGRATAGRTSRRCRTPSTARAPRHIVYYLFDLPYCDGHDLRDVPLERAARAAAAHRAAQAARQRALQRGVRRARRRTSLASACRLGPGRRDRQAARLALRVRAARPTGSSSSARSARSS